MENIRAFYPDVITSTLVISVIYALSTIVMIIATEFQLSGALMIPYMVHQFIIMINTSFFYTLTLAIMPQYSISFIAWSSLIGLASMSLILHAAVNGTNDYLPYFLTTSFTVSLFPFTFRVHFGLVFNSITSLCISFIACLIHVWKVFQMETETMK